MPTYIKIKEFINQGAFRIPSMRGLLDVRSDDDVRRDNENIKKAFTHLSITILDLFKELFLLKTAAFSEEREWRLISYFAKTGTDECSFRPLDDRLVPYREFELLEFGNVSIAEVILGPKNETPNYVIESFLKQNGFANVIISRSVATYR